MSNRLEKLRNHTEVIDAGADRGDLAGCFEGSQHIETAAIRELTQALLDTLRALLMPLVDVVDEQAHRRRSRRGGAGSAHRIAARRRGV